MNALPLAPTRLPSGRLILRVVLSLVIVALGFSFSFGCGRGEAPVASKRDNTFVYIERGNIITLDINQMSWLQDFRVTYAMREGLYSFDPVTSKPVPALAKSTSVSDDKKTWTFTLRDDGKWTNGDPVVAGDFVFSWRLLLESPGDYTALLYSIRGAKEYEAAYRDRANPDFSTVGIRAPDDRTLVVELNDPVAYWPELMSFATFFPRHARSMEPFKRLDDKGRASYDAQYTRPENVVTNGPFQFASWAFGDNVKLKKSETYRDAASVKLDAIECRINTDPQSALAAYERGDIDWLADVDPQLAEPLRGKNRSDLRTAPAFGTAFLTLQCQPENPEMRGTPNPLADVRVRRALAMTIDKRKIVDTITQFGEKPADHFIPPGYLGDFKSEPTPALDPAAAKKLLADAGFPDGRGFPKLSIAYNGENPTRENIAQVLSYQWKQLLGIDVSVGPIELKGFRDALRNKRYTMGLASWYGDYADPTTFVEKYLSTGGNNDAGYANPEYDALLARAAKEPDDAKRTALLEKCESMLDADCPIVPLYHYVNIQLIRDRVEGLTANPRNAIDWKAISIRR